MLWFEYLLPDSNVALHHIIWLYAEHCRRTYEEVERTLDRDHFMTPEQALDWELIDRVVKEREINT